MIALRAVIPCQSALPQPSRSSQLTRARRGDLGSSDSSQWRCSCTAARQRISISTAVAASTRRAEKAPDSSGSPLAQKGVWRPCYRRRAVSTEASFAAAPAEALRSDLPP